MTIGDPFDDDREYRSDGYCIECGQEARSACMCGAPLCVEHFELQAGFCSNVTDAVHGRMFEALDS